MEHDNDFTIPLAIIVVFFLGVGFLMWTSAHASSFLGDREPLTDAVAVASGVIDTLVDPSNPDLGWGDPSIGQPGVYWAIFFAQLLALAMLSLAILSRFQNEGFGLKSRTRLKADTEASLAKLDQLQPLKVDDFIPDRFSLGRLGRHYLAAENRRSKYDPGPQKGKALRQTGDRGPVMFVGPTRSGKSVGVISAMLTWSGPIIAASVKDDLIRPTLANRRRMGETAVFDPTESLRRSYAAAAQNYDITRDPIDAPPPGWDPRLCVNWSPLVGINDFDDALRVADSLADAAPGPATDSTKGDFWINSAKQILAPLLYLAALTGKPFDSVVDWAISPPARDNASPYAPLFDQIAGSYPPHHEQSVRRIETRLNDTLGSPDHKTSLNDIYATLRTIIQPWFSDRLSASASGTSIDLEWLLAGGTKSPRTFYLSTPPHEAKRLQAVFGGCVNELIRQIYKHVEAHGPIEPPLLIVLDEAANMPLPMLPQYASTLAGFGVQLVTVFQDFGQVHGIYGHHLGGSIISNHTSRLFFRGIAEQDTTKWIENATGAEEVENVTTSSGNRSDSETHGTHRLALLPSNVVRQQPLFEALLIHGGLPAAHIQTHRWFENRKLVVLTEWPDDIDGAQGLPNLTARTTVRQSWRSNTDALGDRPQPGDPPASSGSLVTISPKGRSGDQTKGPATGPTVARFETVADFFDIN